MCGNVFAVSPYANTIKQNISPSSFLTISSFPTTAADATFVERMENKAEGYKPYFNRSAFSGMSIEEQDELESMAYRAELERRHQLLTMSHEEYCENNPYDSDNCPDTGILSATPQIPPESIYPVTISGTGDVPYMRAALTPENVAKYNLIFFNYKLFGFSIVTV